MIHRLNAISFLKCVKTNKRLFIYFTQLKKIKKYDLFYQEPEPAPGRKFLEPEPPQNRAALKPCYIPYSLFTIFIIFLPENVSLACDTYINMK